MHGHEGSYVAFSRHDRLVGSKEVSKGRISSCDGQVVVHSWLRCRV